MIARLNVAKPSLRIAVADDEGFMRKYLQTILPRLGHEVVAVAASGRELVEQCREARPDLIITDINMPEMDGLDAAAEVYREAPVPIIVISGFQGPELIERTVSAQVMAYLVKPIKQADLEPVIRLAVRRFEQLESLRREAAELRDSLESGATIEQALRVLMKWTEQNKDEAVRRLRKLSRDKSRQFMEIARMIVEAEEAIASEGQAAVEDHRDNPACRHDTPGDAAG